MYSNFELTHTPTAKHQFLNTLWPPKTNQHLVLLPSSSSNSTITQPSRFDQPQVTRWSRYGRRSKAWGVFLCASLVEMVREFLFFWGKKCTKRTCLNAKSPIRCKERLRWNSLIAKFGHSSSSNCGITCVFETPRKGHTRNNPGTDLLGEQFLQQVTSSSSQLAKTVWKDLLIFLSLSLSLSFSLYQTRSKLSEFPTPTALQDRNGNTLSIHHYPQFKEKLLLKSQWLSWCFSTSS